MNTMKRTNAGDCYEVAGRFALDRATGIGEKSFIGTPYLVHGEVSGQGELTGVRYGHAWVEDDFFVYDFSNKRELIFPKVLYYSIGNIVEEKPKYYRYTFDEANAFMTKTRQFGPWQLKTESGL